MSQQDSINLLLIALYAKKMSIGYILVELAPQHQSSLTHI